METRTIPADQWPTFLDQFSRLHHGKPVRVQSLGPEGAQPIIRDLPLFGITHERSGPSDAGPGAIWLMVGDPSTEHVSHAIQRPTCVRIAEWNDGYSAALEIASVDGYSVILEVGPATETLPPGLVTDGTLAGEQPGPTR